MYFKEFTVRVVNDPEIFGCKPARNYRVIAMTAISLRSGEMVKSFAVPPQQTHVLIKNDENRLKWLSIDRVEVAFNSHIRGVVAADLRAKRYTEELRKAQAQKERIRG